MNLLVITILHGLDFQNCCKKLVLKCLLNYCTLKKWSNLERGCIESLTLVLLDPDMPNVCKQCSSRSVGFFRSQLIWICTVCHSVCWSCINSLGQLIWWADIRSGHSILIFSAWLCHWICWQLEVGVSP